MRCVTTRRPFESRQVSIVVLSGSIRGPSTAGAGAEAAEAEAAAQRINAASRLGRVRAAWVRVTGFSGRREAHDSTRFRAVVHLAPRLTNEQIGRMPVA